VVSRRQGYEIAIRVDRTVTDKVAVTSRVETKAEPTHLVPTQAAEGPIVSTTGIVIAITIVVLLVAEYADRRHRRCSTTAQRHEVELA